jgi:putative transposase
MGVGPLCRLFEKSRQAYYKKEWHLSDVEQIERFVLELIAIVRRELQGLGLHKLYKCIYQPLRTNTIIMGRDRLNTLMHNHGLLITLKRRGTRTTNSNHVFAGILIWLKTLK